MQLAEAAFIEELQGVVSHLTERLSGQTDGKPKVFRDSAVENLTQFFERFRELNVRSNEQLDELVDHCQHFVAGVEPQSLRDNNALRQSMASELSQVQNVLDELLVDVPVGISCVGLAKSGGHDATCHSLRWFIEMRVRRGD